MQRDFNVALEWFHKALIAPWPSPSTGTGGAEKMIGGCYERGEGVPKDLSQAFAWYTKSAAKGFPPGMYNLACLYVNGTVPGVPVDYRKAEGLMRRAADGGHQMARDTLPRLAAYLSQ